MSTVKCSVCGKIIPELSFKKYKVTITPKKIVQTIYAHNVKEAEWKAIHECYPMEAFDGLNPSMLKVKELKK